LDKLRRAVTTVQFAKKIKSLNNGRFTCLQLPQNGEKWRMDAWINQQVEVHGLLTGKVWVRTNGASLFEFEDEFQRNSQYSKQQNWPILNSINNRTKREKKVHEALSLSASITKP
jgi:hypothetical protein